MENSDLFNAPVLARYCVGIDLGTTNCAAAFVDTQTSDTRIEQYLIDQLVDAQTSERRSTFPSFLFHFLNEADRKASFCVGHYARTRGAELPQRQISSAKSWLCHSGVDRKSDLLPWHADEDIQKMSPVAACSQYLEHIRKNWDKEHPEHPLAQQDVVITLPASFDEVARELTVEAAKLAGLPNVLLIEEPQAAFYAWLANHQDIWEQMIHAGQTVLICDIGGGTTDFTLIRVRALQRDSSQSVELEQRYGLHRVAVGDHLLLGGDNLDAALAAHIEKLASEDNGQGFTARAWETVRMNSRAAKEALLSENAPGQYSFFVAGSGRRLLDAGRSVILQADEIRALLLDGFFPVVEYDSIPQEVGTGFREFGLPYAKDPTITKHMAHFLWSHRFAGRLPDDPASSDDKRAARPDWILFNGGVTGSKLIRQRLLDQINTWYQDGSSWCCQELESPSLDLAVSRGAAYFALVKRGIGLGTSEAIRIDARLARSYFLTIHQSPHRVMCVMPASAQTLEQHRFADLPVDIHIGKPVQFPLHFSSTQLNDLAGSIVNYDADTMQNLPPIQTMLQGTKSRKASQATAILESKLSEIGTLQLFLQSVPADGTTESQGDRWKLEFDLRSTVQTNLRHYEGGAERQGLIDEAAIGAAKIYLQNLFASGQLLPASKALMQQLSDILEVQRNQWPASLLRELWQVTMEIQPEHRKKPDAESRWLNLLGYFLRPGFGLAADDWRVAQCWRAVHNKLQNRSSINEAVILWRRISGGFTAGQQQALYQEQQATLTKFLQGNLAGASAGFASELVRLLGSLELLDQHAKLVLLHMLLQACSKEKLKAIQNSILWSIGRVGARQPLYGPLNCVINPESIESLTKPLLKIAGNSAALNSMFVQLARKSGDRYRDMSESCCQQIIQGLRDRGATSRQIAQVESVVQIDSEETAEIAGEALPLGIQLRSMAQ